MLYLPARPTTIVLAPTTSASPVGGSGPGGGGVNPNISANGLAVAFTIANPVGNALAVNFSLQGISQNNLTIGYWIAMPAVGFTINGVKVPGPNHMLYTPRTAVGVDIQGISITQGSASITWEYDLLNDSDLSILMSQFNPANPIVTITYPNELGFWVQKTAYITNFVYGVRQTVLHQNVTITFSGILPD